MRRGKLPLVPVGHDWAMVLGGRLGRRAGDLTQHAVETTRSRLRPRIDLFLYRVFWFWVVVWCN